MEAVNKEKKPLVGIDPDDTDIVRVNGATFTIGVMEAGIWERIENEASLAYAEAKRRTIAKLAREERDPEFVVTTITDSAGKELTILLVDSETQGDPQLRAELVGIMCKGAKYAVRGHEGFVKRDGTPVPFNTSIVPFEDDCVKVVDSQTLRWYRTNTVVLYAIWNGIKTMMSLGPTEKKD